MWVVGNQELRLKSPSSNRRALLEHTQLCRAEQWYVALVNKLTSLLARCPVSHETGDALQQRSCRFNSLKFKAFTSSKHSQLLCSVHLLQFFSSSLFKAGNASSYLSSPFAFLSLSFQGGFFFSFPYLLFCLWSLNAMATATLVHEWGEGGFNHKTIMSNVTCTGYRLFGLQSTDLK